MYIQHHLQGTFAYVKKNRLLENSFWHKIILPDFHHTETKLYSVPNIILVALNIYQFNSASDFQQLCVALFGMSLQ